MPENAESGLSMGTLYSVFGGKGAVYDAVQSDRLSEVFMSAWVESGMREDADRLADRVEQQLERTLFKMKQE